MKIALIRGQFLNLFDMQSYLPLLKKHKVTAFGSKKAIHKKVPFPTFLLTSPTDVRKFPKKMSILNRLFIDANYLHGLEENLKGFDIAHTAETYYHYTRQAINAKNNGYVKKVVTTVWENIAFNNEGIWGRKSFKEHAKQHIDHFIAVSELSKKALITEGFDPKKISVVTPGIDIKTFFPEKNHFAILGEKRKNITILFVGRFEKNKGVLDILHAAVLLKRDKALKNYKISYVFVGQGSQKNAMKQYAKKHNLEHNIIYMTAEYMRMPEVYEMADIFVAPSKKDRYWQEQYGMMLLEAQACGLPIVTTKSGAIPENVGDAAVLVKEGSVKEIAKALKSFILFPSKRVQYGKKARKRTEKMYDVRLIAKKIDKIYRSVLSI